MGYSNYLTNGEAENSNRDASELVPLIRADLDYVVSLIAVPPTALALKRFALAGDALEPIGLRLVGRGTRLVILHGGGAAPRTPRGGSILRRGIAGKRWSIPRDC